MTIKFKTNIRMNKINITMRLFNKDSINLNSLKIKHKGIPLRINQ